MFPICLFLKTGGYAVNKDTVNESTDRESFENRRPFVLRQGARRMAASTEACATCPRQGVCRGWRGPLRRNCGRRKGIPAGFCMAYFLHYFAVYSVSDRGVVTRAGESDNVLCRKSVVPVLTALLFPNGATMATVLRASMERYAAKNAHLFASGAEAGGEDATR